MTVAGKWKWAYRQVREQLNNRKKINIQKLMASARTTHNIKYVEQLFDSHEFAEARNVVDYTVKDIVTGKVADNHLIMDMAKLCVKNGIKIAKKGRIRYGKGLIDKARDIYAWFADRLLRMIKTLSAAFNFKKKSETPTYVIALDALIRNAYGFIDTLFGKFETACDKLKEAIQLEYKLFDRNAKDFIVWSFEKKIGSEIGDGTYVSMALGHLHLAACFTSLKKYQMARQEAKHAVNYLIEIQKDTDFIEASTSNQRDVQKKISDVKYMYAVALYNFGVGEMNTKRYTKGVGEMYKAYVVAVEAVGEHHENAIRLKKLYLKARKQSYPGLGRYPILDDPVEVPKHREQLQTDKSCFPSGLYYKAFSRCIEATYLLPYSYRLTHGAIETGTKISELHKISNENIKMDRRKRLQKAFERDEWYHQKKSGRKSPPMTSAFKKMRRPSTAFPARVGFNVKQNERRPHTSLPRQRTRKKSYIDNNMVSSISPMKGNSRVPYRKNTKRRPRTASAINLRARRIYVKSQESLFNTPSRPTPHPPYSAQNKFVHKPRRPRSSKNVYRRRRRRRPASASPSRRNFKQTKPTRRHQKIDITIHNYNRPQSSPTYHTPQTHVRDDVN
eukprot:g9009.t1